MKTTLTILFALSMIISLAFLGDITSSAQAQIRNRQLTVRKGSNSRRNTRTLEDVSRNSRVNRADDWHTRGLRRKGHRGTLNFRKRKFQRPSYQRYHKHTGNHPVR
jgi:Ni/Co efflux regulator RcnB